VPNEISLSYLFLHADAFVKLVMIGLLLLSILSWAIIIQRYKLLKTAQKQRQDFETKFWSGIDLNVLYKELNPQKVSGLERLFCSGVKEYMRLSQISEKAPAAVMDGIHRAMNVSLNRELTIMESNLPTLATIGSISPYIGLFGTVWGIMNSFMALSSQTNATLSMVAPGIAEALVATALGLFAAIPAVAAYNRFTHHVSKLEDSYTNFIEELTNILHRQTYSVKGSK
jgi:biopolymer transport protein TolQ